MFQFTDDCLIGVPQLDEEHRHLFELLNEGADLVQNEYTSDRYELIKNLLEKLEDYAELHFTHEEAYMEEICDPELIRQRSQHMSFRDKIREWSFTDIDDEQEQERILNELVNYLARWLYRHIIGSDTMIGKLPPLEKWMLKENPCEFCDEYRTGIDFVDSEHEELFRITDKANKLIRDEFVYDAYDDLTAILNELRDYTKRHFQDEEAYMERIHYGGLAAQRRAHEAFIEKISDIDLDEIEGDPKIYLESLIEFLLGWLVNHILYTDMKIPVTV